MGRFGDDKIEEVRSRADIVEIVGAHVRLRRAGRNFVGLCPFHNEKTPSFSVNAERGFFHCFGCGAGGSVFNFIMRVEGLTFHEAVRSLARKYGVTLPEHDQSGPAAGEREAMLKANEVAAEFFAHVLWNTTDGALARDYLKTRGISVETARAFMIGFAPSRPASLAKALERRGLRDAGVKVGLVKKDGDAAYDMFRARVMFRSERICAEPAGIAGEGAGTARTARRGGESRAGQEGRRRRVRHVSRARDVPDSRRAGQGDRIRRPRARRAPAQVHQLARIAAVLESANSVRTVRSAPGDFIERIIRERPRDYRRGLLRCDCAVAGWFQGSGGGMRHGADGRAVARVNSIHEKCNRVLRRRRGGAQSLDAGAGDFFAGGVAGPRYFYSVGFRSGYVRSRARRGLIRGADGQIRVAGRLFSQRTSRRGARTGRRAGACGASRRRDAQAGR